MMEALANGYGVPIFDYRRDSTGLLVSSGAGIMIAVMDACPVFRWCLDIDRNKDAERLASFLFCADLRVDPFGVVGWFSITPPAPLQAALRRLPNLGRVLAYTKGAVMPAGFHFDTLESFIGAANNHALTTAGVTIEQAHWHGKRVESPDRAVKVSADEKSFEPEPDPQPVRAHCERQENNGVSTGEALLGSASARQAIR